MPDAPGPRSVARTIVTLALPLLALRVLTFAMFIVDAIVCGQLPDSAAKLAGMAIAFQVIFVLDVTVQGLCMGAIALVARARGAGDVVRQREVVDQASRLSVICAIAIAVAGSVVARPLLGAFDSTPAVLDSAVAYFRPIIAVSVFSYLGLLYGMVCVGLRDTRTPLYCGAAGAIVNAVLTIGLGLGELGMPALGVTGIAVGTAASQSFTALLLTIAIRRKQLPIALLPTRIDRGPTLEIIRIGLPAASDMFLMTAHAVVVVLMFTELSQAAVAAHGIGVRVQLFVNLPVITIGAVCSVLVGGALGAGDARQARAIGHTAMILGVATMAVLGAALVVFATPVAAVFGVEAGSALENYAVEWLQIIGVGCLPIALHLTRAGAIAGAGATSTTMRISIASIVVQLPLAWLLAFRYGLGPFGVWLALGIAYLVRAALAEIAYRRGLWAIPGLRVQAKEKTAHDPQPEAR